MKRYLVIIYWLVFVCLTSTVLATNQVQINSWENIEPDFLKPGSANRQIYGDIYDINTTSLTIKKNSSYFQFNFAPRAKIYCNGLAASWKALLPIATDAYFEAEVVLNNQNEVIVLDGSYHGEECIINGWLTRPEYLSLELIPVDNQPIKSCPVQVSAVLPLGNWLSVGQVIYILYNQAGQIRAVFLPS